MGHLNEVLRGLTGDDPKKTVQGRRFERLVQAALRAHPGEYGRERFEEVWLWNEWPDRTALGYGADIGIDIVARQTPAYGGGLCAVQCKFYERQVPTSGVDSFLAASATGHFTSRLLVATARVSKNGMLKLRRADPRCEVLHTSEMDRWVDDWRDVIDTPEQLEIPPPPKHVLYPFQQAAVVRIADGFQGADRGQLILPCGTGKSLVALRAAERVAGRGGRVLYLVPSIALIGQTMREWSRQREMPLRYLGVCSDPTAGRRASKQADVAGDLTELAIPVTTDPKKLAAEFAKPAPEDAMQVVFSTYQSSPQIKAAQEQAGTEAVFDLIICDEAHRTTGIEESKQGLGVSPFRIVHDDEHIPSRKRLYMTATPRVFTERQKKKITDPAFEGDSYSMADPETFGERFYEMEFSEAVEGEYLTDYEVLVITASEEAYLQSLANVGLSHEVLVQESTNLALDDAVKLAGCWDALASPATTVVEEGRRPGQVFEEGGEPARSAIAFTNLVRTSETAAAVWPKVVDALARQRPAPDGNRGGGGASPYLLLDVDHVDGSTPAAERTDLLEKLRGSREAPGLKGGAPTCRVLSNARVLTEGVDVPSLDAVLFLNSRTSTVDITQAVGRAMRLAPGKEKGYIIIPVVVPDGAPPQEMLKSSDFKTVWEVVRALRSHDSRVEYYVSNASAWAKNAPLRISHRLGRDDGDEHEQRMQQQLQLQLHHGIASMVVEKVGDKQMYPRWGQRAADVCRQVQTRVNELVERGGARPAFERFLAGIRSSIGDHITRRQAQEMVAQHVVTIPIFEAMLAGSGFAHQNPVSREIERLLETFAGLGVSFEEELAPLTRAYQQMSNAFEGAVTSADRVDILREVYNGFFHAAMKDTVKRVGIVYTPVQIVDFMVRSAAAICQKEFGRSIGSENLHVLDPFAGTGTFLARLIEMKDEDGNYLISPEDLDRKYKEELHANELILLAYYIAAIKIEEAKHSRDAEGADEEEVTFEPYMKICLSDTFLTSPEQEEFGIFSQNIRGRREQDATPMTVVLANPPWSSGQKDAGDDNPNLEYEDVGRRVEETYIVKHKEITGRAPGGNASGNLYVKALRWCSDRILPNTERGGNPAIIGLVHPNSLTDGTSLAGVRATFRDEYTGIYVVNLRGNAYKSGEEFRREGDKIFGGGSRNGVQITFLVRNPAKDIDQAADLHYAQVPDYMNLDKKWEWLEQLTDVTNPRLEKVPVTPQHDWINISDGTFERLLAVCDTDKQNTEVGFLHHARGVGTSCDVYVYAFSRQKLIERMEGLIDAYDDALEWYDHDPRREVFEKATTNDMLDEIKWTDTLKQSLKRRKRIEFDESRIREVLYRPFTKLWLYEDDRILSAVKTVSAMFPRGEEVESCAVTGGSNNGSPDSLVASDVLPDLNSVGPGRGGGASHCQRAILISSGNNMIFQALAASNLTDLAAIKGSQQTRVIPRRRRGGGGGAGDSRHHPLQQDGLRRSRDRGHRRPLRSRNHPAFQGNSQTAILMTGPSNMATFGTLAAALLPDLHTMAAGQQTRTIPRRR